MILRAFRKTSAGGAAGNTAAPAAFGDTAADRERLDWLLFQNGGVVLYHKQQILAEHTAWLLREGYQLRELDANGWKDPKAFHEDVKRVFAFPSHYTSNLASLVDSLSELEIPPGGAVAVQMKRYDRFAKIESHLAWSVLDALETTSRRLLLTGRRLLTLVQSDDPRIKFERVGAMPVNWNPREWLDSDRGIGNRESGIGNRE
jgi:RNAse (barnase) inhibitor barstar